MKRQQSAKRRNRKTGESPYCKKSQGWRKGEYRYSAAYYTWRSRFVRQATKEEQRRAAH